MVVKKKVSKVSLSLHASSLPPPSLAHYSPTPSPPMCRVRPLTLRRWSGPSVELATVSLLLALLLHACSSCQCQDTGRGGQGCDRNGQGCGRSGRGFGCGSQGCRSQGGATTAEVAAVAAAVAAGLLATTTLRPRLWWWQPWSLPQHPVSLPWQKILEPLEPLDLLGLLDLLELL